MKLTKDELLAIAFTFEQRMGQKKDDYECKLIEEHISVTKLDSKNMEELIVNGLNKNFYTEDENRTLAYWALSKTYNKELIPKFQKWLAKELEENKPGQIYQLLIALDNLDENVFSRTGTAALEEELNRIDAENYLKKYS